MINPNNAIEVRNMKKKFKVYFDKGHMLKERLIFSNRNKHEDRWVLNGVSFDIKKGEAVGLIGKNGCGKSTTLKLLNRIIYPNDGTVEINGKVSSLIELGAGFHEDMTGRENIYINASIFGLTRKEIDDRLEDIIRFSELEEFIDNPVRTYSSGMYMRLAFSVAINVDADILLIDEILAVGDVNFQEKCFQKLRDIKRSGTTIVIVSHSLGQIEKICDRAIWIDEGLIKEDGIPRDICNSYLQSMEYERLERAEQEYLESIKKNTDEFSETLLSTDEAKGNDIVEPTKTVEKEELKITTSVENKGEIDDSPENVFEDSKLDLYRMAKRRGNGVARISNISIWANGNDNAYVIDSKSDVRVRISYECREENINADFRCGIYRDDGTHCLGISSKLEGNIFKLDKKGVVSLVFDKICLLEGRYFLDIGIRNEEGDALDIISMAKEFHIKKGSDGEYGVYSQQHRWE